MIAQVRGSFDKYDAMRLRSKDGYDDGGLATVGHQPDDSERAAPRQLPKLPHVSELAQKDCVPCRGGVPPFTREQIAPLLHQLGGDWQVSERGPQGSVLYLERTYRFKNFAAAMKAAVAIGDMAEEQSHHPDLHVAWGAVRVEVWTHKIGGLTESDFIFAAKCDAIVAQL